MLLLHVCACNKVLLYICVQWSLLPVTCLRPTLVTPCAVVMFCYFSFKVYITTTDHKKIRKRIFPLNVLYICLLRFV